MGRRVGKFEPHLNIQHKITANTHFLTNRSDSGLHLIQFRLSHDLEKLRKTACVKQTYPRRMLQTGNLC